MREQQKEIETIRERKIAIKLSDADCDRIARLCGKHNITVEYLLESFIGDLVDGTYTNGSDERDLANRYFERCWFGMFPEKNLLNYLLSEWEMDSFMEYLDIVENLRDCIEHSKENIANADTIWENLVHHEYNEDRTSYKCVPTYKSVEEYIASEKECMEDDERDLNEALENIEEIRKRFDQYMKEEAYVWEDEVEKVKTWWEAKEDLINE